MMRRLVLFAAALVAACGLSPLLGADAGETGPRRALLVNASKPTWSFNFAARGTIPAGATFTRASSRSCWNSSGVLVTLTTNTPCFPYNPATLQSLGYLAEMASTNYIVYSSDGTGWTVNSFQNTTTDGTLGPDGSTLANKITATATTGSHYSGRGATSGLSANNIVGHSAFVKQGSTRYAVIVDVADGPYRMATFDFQTGTYVSTGLNAGTLQPPQQLPNGWWRIGFVVVTTNGSAGVWVAPGNSTVTGTSTSDFAYAAAGTETVYATGIQIDSPGVGVTSYIATNGSAVTRAQDVLTMPLTSLAGWRATQGGVLVAAYRLNTVVPSTPGYNQMAVWFYKTDYTNSIRLMANSSGGGNAYFDTYSGGVAQGAVTPSAAAAYVRHKMAGGWSVPRNVVAQDGGTPVGVNTATAFPVAPDTAGFGLYSSHGLNGTLESVAYYAGARSDAFVQQVSR